MRMPSLHAWLLLKGWPLAAFVLNLGVGSSVQVKPPVRSPGAPCLLPGGYTVCSQAMTKSGWNLCFFAAGGGVPMVRNSASASGAGAGPTRGGVEEAGAGALRLRGGMGAWGS